MKNILTTFFVLLFANHVFANNLAISAPVYSAENLTFTISWDNSWNISSGPSNHDAVWIFIKRQKCTGNNNWVHQLVSTTSGDHTAKTGINPSSIVSVIGVSDGMGVFIKRIGTDVVGNVASQTITLKLAATNPSISTTANDNFKVIGVEMVYVPQGEFYIGDGRTSSTNGAFVASGTSSPLKITNNIQNVNGLGAASNYTNNNTYGCSMPLPTTFPLGYNSFYTMKYEILQGVFIEYLNTLTYDQQAARLKISNAAYLPNATTPVLFHGNSNWGSINVYTTTAGNYNTKSAVFGGNYPYIPMGCLNWQDLASFLDWSGLRPMSEFEYEKACRGNNGGPTGTANAPIAFEYPWGSTVLTGGNNGNYYNYQTSATATWSVYDGACRNWEDNGPIRAGFAATSTSNRSQSGSTYYGIMEMAGNIWEQCVGGGAGYDYSTFSTSNGDGLLTAVGLADVIGWPSSGGLTSGTILKGGHFASTSNYFQYQVSDRYYYGGNTENAATTRLRYIGGRGARSF